MELQTTAQPLPLLNNIPIGRKVINTTFILCYGQLEEKDRNMVFSCSGIVRYLFFLEKPAVVPCSDINLMQDHLNGVYKDIKVTTPTVGQSHTITEGPFSGVIGKVVQIDIKKLN